MASEWCPDGVRKGSHMRQEASGWRQDGVRTTSGKCQDSVRMASGWRRDGVSEHQDSATASGTRQDASEWRQDDVRMASGCVRMALGRRHRCVRVEV